MDEDTTFYATMYQGAIRTLNEKYPLLYRTRAGAIRESRRFTGVSVVSVNARDFDLAQCSIDDTWPTGISTPGCLVETMWHTMLVTYKPGGYPNAGGLRRWCTDNGDGIPGWEDWYDEATGEDGPITWVQQAQREALAEESPCTSDTPTRSLLEGGQ